MINPAPPSSVRAVPRSLRRAGRWLADQARRQVVTRNRRVAMVLALITVTVAIIAAHVSEWLVSPGVMILPMRAALDEASAALATDDVPIGAVVLAPDGTTIGRGRNVREAEADPTGHAEVVALRAAARERGEWRLEGCTLVVTLEPCTMCAGAAVLSRVERVVFGAFDPKAGAVGSLWDVVRDRRLNHRPEVVAGILADESAALLEGFFAAHRA